MQAYNGLLNGLFHEMFDGLFSELYGNMFAVGESCNALFNVGEGLQRVAQRIAPRSVGRVVRSIEQ